GVVLREEALTGGLLVQARFQRGLRASQLARRGDSVPAHQGGTRGVQVSRVRGAARGERLAGTCGGGHQQQPSEGDDATTHARRPSKPRTRLLALDRRGWPRSATTRASPASSRAPSTSTAVATHGAGAAPGVAARWSTPPTRRFTTLRRDGHGFVCFAASCSALASASNSSAVAV